MAGATYGFLYEELLGENGTKNCSWNNSATPGKYSLPVTIVSSTLSIAGSILIIFTFAMWKDVRKSIARKILLFLAIADLFGALGYFCGAIVYLFLPTNRTMCRIQSFWTTYFPVASFFWTAYLAIYFAVALVLKKPNWTSKLMIPFHLTAWLIPLVICVPLVGVGWLGPNPTNVNSTAIYRSQVAGGWCFVSSMIFEKTNSTDEFDFWIKIYFLVEAVSGKMWEMLAYVVVIVCYCLIVCSNRCKCCKVIVCHILTS